MQESRKNIGGMCYEDDILRDYWRYVCYLFGKAAEKYVQDYGPAAVEQWEKETGQKNTEQYIKHSGYLTGGVYGLPELVDYALSKK